MMIRKHFSDKPTLIYQDETTTKRAEEYKEALTYSLISDMSDLIRHHDHYIKGLEEDSEIEEAQADLFLKSREKLTKRLKTILRDSLSIAKSESMNPKGIRWFHLKLKDSVKMWGYALKESNRGKLRRGKLKNTLNNFSKVVSILYDSCVLLSLPVNTELVWETSEGFNTCTMCKYLESRNPYLPHSLPFVPRSGNTICSVDCACSLRIGERVNRGATRKFGEKEAILKELSGFSTKSQFYRYLPKINFSDISWNLL